jgi:acyl-coenzyme A synthetase/AMP-(fatty) acid ligase
MVRLFEAGVVQPIDVRSAFASSSAPLSAALRQRFNELSGCRLTDIYGSTEAGGIAYRHQDGPWTVQPHVEIRIDEEKALWVRSPSVSFETEEGFYRIGDLVEPADGGFILIGRKDDVVKVGGRRIALGEVQAAFEACEAVQRAAVLSIERRGALRLVAFLEPSDRASLDVDAVKQFVRARLADHKIPGIVRVLDKLPVTSSGKLARQELTALLKKRE